MPPQANNLPQASHLRRESSQSAHGDAGNHNMNMNRGFPPAGGRGRGYNQGYNPQMGHNSPGPNYRSLQNGPRNGPLVPPFQPQHNMGAQPNSPFRGSRSPHITPAAMQQQAQFANQAPIPYGQ